MQKEIPTQFEYLGRWVDTKHFCAFVYSKTEQKLAKNYTEFTDLIGTGLWFATKAEALKVLDSTPLDDVVIAHHHDSAQVRLSYQNNSTKKEKKKSKGLDREKAKKLFKQATNLGN